MKKYFITFGIIIGILVSIIAIIAIIGTFAFFYIKNNPQQFGKFAEKVHTKMIAQIEPVVENSFNLYNENKFKEICNIINPKEETICIKNLKKVKTQNGKINSYDLKNAHLHGNFGLQKSSYTIEIPTNFDTSKTKTIEIEMMSNYGQKIKITKIIFH